MEFFKIGRDIPFMRYAKVFNAISFATFALALFFLVPYESIFLYSLYGCMVLDTDFRNPVLKLV